MSSTTIYWFDDQLEKWKAWERKVFEYLRKKKETIEVKDLSLAKDFQAMWVDWMRIYEGSDWIAFARFFDVKTDFYVNKNWRIFIETGCSTEWKTGNLMSTKAEYFLYYDPVGGLLYHVPIFPLRRWYKQKWIAKKHHTVQNKWFETEWITLTIEELDSIFPLEIEDIWPISSLRNSTS